MKKLLLLLALFSLPALAQNECPAGSYVPPWGTYTDSSGVTHQSICYDSTGELILPNTKSMTLLGSSALKLPNGSTTAPSLSFANDTASGLWLGGAGLPVLQAPAGGKIAAKISSSNILLVTNLDDLSDSSANVSGNGFNVAGTGLAAGFRAGAVNGSVDVALTRTAAGKFALGNGTAGDHSAELDLGTSQFKSDPWFDVRAYGAKCDNTTDDATAIASAITAAGASNGIVYFPQNATCLDSAQITLLSNLTFQGTNSTLKYTGTAAPFASCAGCVGITFRNLTVTCNNAGFTGVLVSITGSASGKNLFDNASIFGAGSCVPSYDVDLTNGIGNEIRFSTFGGSTKGINVSGANNTTFVHPFFDTNGAGAIASTYIDGLSQGSTVHGGQFEFVGAGNSAGPIIDSSASGCFGCDISGIWAGDLPATWTGTMIKGAGGMHIHGSTFAGASGAGGTLIQDNATTNCFDFEGNYALNTWAVGFNLGASQASPCQIQSNLYGTITSFLSGSVTFGIVQDTSKATTVNGPLVSGGTVATLSGTGACATITTQVGGSWAGSAKCTGTAGASTLTITPGTTAPNGWICHVQDETTRTDLFQQTSHNATTCTLTAGAVAQNDVFVFSAIAF